MYKVRRPLYGVLGYPQTSLCFRYEKHALLFQAKVLIMMNIAATLRARRICLYESCVENTCEIAPDSLYIMLVPVTNMLKIVLAAYHSVCLRRAILKRHLGRIFVTIRHHDLRYFMR